MFAINKPRMDAVALIMLTVLPLTGVITMGEALTGFSDPNIVLIAALFVIGDGLVRTGVARRLGDWLTATAGSSETRLLVLLMLVVCGLGATMSSTAVTAIFIPVVLRISQSMGTSPSGLMMPLSFAALISGMTTLIATAPNLVVNSELVAAWRRRGISLLQLHAVRRAGSGPGHHLHAVRPPLADGARRVGGRDGSHRPSLRDWIKEYKLAAREHRVRVRTGSPLVGKTLAELRLRDASGRHIVAIERSGKLIQPAASTELQAGDILFVDLFAAGRRRRRAAKAIRLGGVAAERRVFHRSVAGDRHGRGDRAGQLRTLSARRWLEADFRIALRAHRHRTAARRHSPGDASLQNERLKIGDTLLVIGPWKAIRRLQSDSKDLVVFNLPVELEEVLPVAGKAPQAVFCLLLVVGLMVSGVVPNVQAALIGCLLMGVLGCVDLNSAYRSIDWKTIVLIVGMLPFSIALERTGGVELAADGLMAVVGGAGSTRCSRRCSRSRRFWACLFRTRRRPC